MHLHIQGMRYAEDAGFHPEKRCLSDTRTEIIEEIEAWVKRVDAHADIFWLNGVAGSGKSAIAHSVAQIFSDKKQLGSAFFFNRAKQATHNATHLFSTISRDLANNDSKWKSKLYKAIVDNDSTVKSTSVSLHFKSFFKDIANDLTFLGPVVIVIDALDECGTGMSRKTLLAILKDEIPKMPGNFRFIITSRPEGDIVPAFKSFQNQKSMDGVKETLGDIEKYINSQLTPILEDNLFLNVWDEIGGAKHLVTLSEGLFQWASTVCSLIEHPSVGITTSEQLRWVSDPKKSGALYNLYEHILLQIVNPKNADSLQAVKIVIGVILTAKTPIDIVTVGQLLTYKMGQNSLEKVKAVLKHMGSLFNGTSDMNVPLQPLHTSIWDYLTSTEAKEFQIDLKVADQELLHMTLKLMKEELCFNICKLPTSHQINKDIPDIERLKKNISVGLVYAAKHWTDHLQHAPQMDNTVTSGVKCLIKKKLLYWIEVLSLLESINLFDANMGNVADWAKVS